MIQYKRNLTSLLRFACTETRPAKSQVVFENMLVFSRSNIVHRKGGRHISMYALVAEGREELYFFPRLCSIAGGDIFGIIFVVWNNTQN